MARIKKKKKKKKLCSTWQRTRWLYLFRL